MRTTTPAALLADAVKDATPAARDAIMRAHLGAEPRAFSVCWRARDGKGTHVWKANLTAAEAEAEVRWCEGAHPEATMVWALRSSDGVAHRLRLREPTT